jgi:transposase
MIQRIPFTHLSDAEWEALRPYLARAAPQGRPIRDARQRMNGIFRLVATDAPWREVPEEYGAAATVARHFRRLTHAALWERLLQALYGLEPTHPLYGLRRIIFRCCRRAARIRGLRLIMLARRLGFEQALPGPPWMVADPDLSESLRRWQLRHRDNFPAFVRRWGKTLRTLLTLAGGRPNMPRAVRLALP